MLLKSYLKDRLKKTREKRKHIMIQGLTNVSGRPGQQEKGSEQPQLGVWLPGGQPRYSYVFFLINRVNIFSIS